jgi:hypothetical protein
VCISLACDGFTPSKSGRKSNLTMILLNNYNLPPDKRYVGINYLDLFQETWHPNLTNTLYHPLALLLNISFH